jgi:hypothetical protein
MQDNPQPPLGEQDADKLLRHGLLQYSWYEDETLQAERRLARVWWFGTIAGLSASALAALPESIIGQAWGDITRYIVAVLTLLVTLFSGTLVSRYRRVAVDRERGRVATAELLNLTRVTLMFEEMLIKERAALLKDFEKGLIMIERLHGTAEGQPSRSGEGHAPT